MASAPIQTKDVLRIQMLCGNLEQEALGVYVSDPTCIDEIITDLYRGKVWLKKTRDKKNRERQVMRVTGAPDCEPGFCPDNGICVVCPPTPPKKSEFEGARVSMTAPGVRAKAGRKSAPKDGKHARP